MLSPGGMLSGMVLDQQITDATTGGTRINTFLWEKEKRKPGGSGMLFARRRLVLRGRSGHRCSGVAHASAWQGPAANGSSWSTCSCDQRAQKRGRAPWLSNSDQASLSSMKIILACCS